MIVKRGADKFSGQPVRIIAIISRLLPVRIEQDLTAGLAIVQRRD